jgi:hypothetical protein
MAAMKSAQKERNERRRYAKPVITRRRRLTDVTEQVITPVSGVTIT